MSNVGRIAEALSSNAARPGDRDFGHSAKPKPKKGKKGLGDRGIGDTDFERKHKRAAKGSAQGGQFVQMGSTGSDVSALQKRLGVKADGKFGEETRKRVMEFQRKNGLKVDGIVGHQTVVALAGNTETARTAKPGALKGSDLRKLEQIRSGSSGGGSSSGGSARASRKGPSDDSPDFNWRRQGNKKRGVIMKDGSRRVVGGSEYDRLRREGKLASRTPKLRGD